MCFTCISIEIVSKTSIFQYLLTHLMKKEKKLDMNKLYFAEILSILLIYNYKINNLKFNLIFLDLKIYLIILYMEKLYNYSDYELDQIIKKFDSDENKYYSDQCDGNKLTYIKVINKIFPNDSKILLLEVICSDLSSDNFSISNTPFNSA